MTQESGNGPYPLQQNPQEQRPPALVLRVMERLQSASPAELYALYLSQGKNLDAIAVTAGLTEEEKKTFLKELQEVLGAQTIEQLEKDFAANEATVKATGCWPPQKEKNGTTV